MTETFEVQTREGDHWSNAWRLPPQVPNRYESFSTRAEAQRALDEFFADIDNDIAHGELHPDFRPKREDWRVVEVPADDGDTVGALRAAESFIAGFEGDPSQEGIRQLLDRIHMAIAARKKQNAELSKDVAPLLSALIYIVNACEHPACLSREKAGVLDHLPKALEQAKKEIAKFPEETLISLGLMNADLTNAGAT